MTDGLDMRRALDCTLASTLPVGNGLLAEARLGIVVCQQLRLCLSHFWQALFQHLRNACMVLLPRTPY